MRILILSNFYPPAHAGGYTQLCQEVSEGLAQRGHTIGVVTSRHDLAKAQGKEQDIYRLLHLESDLHHYQPLRFLTHWKRHHGENLALLERVVSAFSPELIFVWGMWGMSKAVPAWAERLMPGRVVYYLADYWPLVADMHTTYWRSPSRRWLMRLPKRFLSALAMSILPNEPQPRPRFEQVICVSARLREILVEAGLPLRHARVIYNGIDVARFYSAHQPDHPARRLRLLYAGQLVQHKGVHTGIQAMARLVDERRINEVHLTVIGSGHREYERSLRSLVVSERLVDYVTFLEPVARDSMPDLLRRFDVLILPSLYEEPLARITQEAMASGLVVVGTTTGGTKEILSDGETGLTFAPGDANGLADQVVRLVSDPELHRRLVQAGRRTVVKRFTLNRMVTEIDAYLRDCLADRSGSYDPD
ncbi:MAG: glycosyltransferase family 4 protein [Anaerolineales bacterium]